MTHIERKGEGGKLPAVGKGIFADHPQRFGEVDSFQFGAVVKGTFVNDHHPVGDGVFRVGQGVGKFDQNAAFFGKNDAPFFVSFNLAFRSEQQWKKQERNK